MRRREIALVVALAAAVAAGSIGVSFFVSSERADRIPDATRTRDLDRTVASARDEAAPAAVEPVDVAAGPSPRVDDAAAAGPVAQRELDGAEEVDFPGLITLAGASADGSGLDGTIVFRNADPGGPPLCIEVPVKNLRFRGRGPGNAVVAIERLVLAGREAAAREERFRLATRWLQVTATLAPQILLHVVDAASGRELSGVTLRETVHSESSPAVASGIVANAVGSGGFCIVQSRRSKSPPAGFDSPLRIARFAGLRDPFFPPPPKAMLHVVLAHVAGYGDDLAVFGKEEEREVTLCLRAAASLRVTVASERPADGDADSARAPRVVTVAREIELAAAGGTDGADATGGRLPADCEPRLERLARELLARRRIRELAAQSPQLHTAGVDEHGVATFEDLCEGRWIAWVDRPGGAGASMTIVSGRRILNRFGAPPIDAVSCDLFAGGRSELTLRGDPSEPERSTLAVRVIDSESRKAIALRIEEIAVNDLEDPDSGTRPIAPRVDRFNVRPGIAVVTIRPRFHREFGSVTRWVEIREGANEVEIPLERPAAVEVVIDTDSQFVGMSIEGTDPYRLRLTREGAEFKAVCWADDADPPRPILRFEPLEPGRYQLIVPDGAGFDRPGELAVEVLPHQVTSVELRRRDVQAISRDVDR